MSDYIVLTDYPHQMKGEPKAIVAISWLKMGGHPVQMSLVIKLQLVIVRQYSMQFTSG